MTEHTTEPHRYGRNLAAEEAADALAADGHHVHVVSSGETRCHTGHCPTPQH
ncbi:hypothetical protein [Streptomyces sp. MMS24-I29]|uniref:hypothetical protein n=1 Tax=Streptomyces sp. MMS24-I29 TaxID=3351480 RepID=UPI003C7BB2C6